MTRQVPSYEKTIDEIEAAPADLALRPTALSEFVGQPEVKRNLTVALGAAKRRGEMVDHILFFGPPGLGKTTLAEIVAHEMDASFRQTSAPAIGRPGDLAAMLTAIEPDSVLFIDEIHRLPPAAAELLYTAMEDYAFDLVIGDGARGRSVRIELPRFTLVGATTRSGSLPAPLLDRFGITLHLDYYGEEELLRILERDAALLGLRCEKGALEGLAGRARGTPRVAKKLLRRVRDYAEMENGGVVESKGVESCLEMLGIDGNGLDGQDRKYLTYLIAGARGKPVGIGTIAAAISEDPATIEAVVEPFLLKKGFIQRTPRGRVPTQDAVDQYARDAFRRPDAA